MTITIAVMYLPLSVIIPTHNRAASLAPTLQSALELDYPPDRYEVLVVDNASTDQTADVVRELQAAPRGSTVRYLKEERLGVHNARHAGARAADGEVLLFTDDDATFSPQWASAYAAEFNAHRDMAAAGGPVRAAWDAPPPAWLVELMELKEPSCGGQGSFGPLALLDLSDQLVKDPSGFFVVRSAMSASSFFSINMAIRRDALFEVGGFNPALHGSTLLGDGETGLIFKLLSRGLRIGYVPDAEVDHHIRPERMTVRYLRQRMANQGASDAYTEFHAKMPNRWRLGREAVTTAARAVRSGVKAVRAWNKTDPASLRAQIGAASETRRLAYTVRVIFDAHLRALVERDNWL